MNIKQNRKFEVTGNRDKQSKKLKKRFPQLTDTDLSFEAGKENEMVKRIRAKLNQTNEEVIFFLKKIQQAQSLN